MLPHLVLAEGGASLVDQQRVFVPKLSTIHLT
jgi:hypothetical protein